MENLSNINNIEALSMYNYIYQTFTYKLSYQSNRRLTHS